MITAPFPSTAFRTRVPTRSVPRSSRGAAWLTPAGWPTPPRSCPRIVPAHSRDDHTIRRNLMCVPARRKPKTKKARLAVWHAGTPRALQPFVSFDSSSSTFSGNCRKYQQKRMSYDQTVCRLFFHCRGKSTPQRATALDRLDCRACEETANRRFLFSSGRFRRWRETRILVVAPPRCHTRARGTRGPRRAFGRGGAVRCAARRRRMTGRTTMTSSRLCAAISRTPSSAPPRGRRRTGSATRRTSRTTAACSGHRRRQPGSSCGCRRWRRMLDSLPA